MKSTSSLIFLIVLIASGFCEDSTTTIVSTSGQPDTTIETTVASTSQKPDTTTTTDLPSSTLSTTTTDLPSSTTLSTTTTDLPSSTTLPTTTIVVPTTSKPTTTSLPDTTTSPSTTVSPATTTKSPEPPTPEEGSWNVTEGNLTCIRADLKIRFKITVKDHVEYISLSPNAASSGNCSLSNNTQELTLVDSEFTIMMTFEKDSDNTYLKNVSFSYLPDSRDTVYNDTKLFSVKLGNSYICNSLTDVNLGNVTMEILHIHIQSFGSVGNKDFGTAEDCEADNKVDNMVPIAVGIALLVLVAIVLVAYFVGRRRSRQRGYQSV